jgi:hypothetical protein
MEEEDVDEHYQSSSSSRSRYRHRNDVIQEEYSGESERVSDSYSRSLNSNYPRKFNDVTGFTFHGDTGANVTAYHISSTPGKIPCENTLK